MIHRTMLAATALLVACGPTGEEPVTEDMGSSSGPSSTTSTTRSTGSDPATTGTVSSTTDSSDGDPGDGSAFLSFPDGGTVCSPSDPLGLAILCQCDVWAQDCPEDSKCAPWANDGTDKWSATKCAPLHPNPDPIGAPCQVEGSASSGVDTCELGAMCWNVDPDTLEGHCVGFCGGNHLNPICSDPQDACAIFNYGTLVLCLPECDPLADACGGGFACRPAQPSGVPFAFVCLPTDAGGQVIDGCEGMGGCPVGQACTGPNVCAAYCDLADPLADEACGAETEGHVCHPFFTEPMMAPPQYAHVGVCGPS